jgi:type I restriction enzyme M protein
MRSTSCCPIGVIFKGARCEIHSPALLKQLIVNLLDKVDWLSLPVDVKGTIYKELLARSAQESSRGAGQYFTTRRARRAPRVKRAERPVCFKPLAD